METVGVVLLSISVLMAMAAAYWFGKAAGIRETNAAWKALFDRHGIKPM